MFDKQYRFRGIHAVRVDALTSVFDDAVTAKLFDRNVDVYTNAPLVGFYIIVVPMLMIQKSRNKSDI